MSLLAQLKYTGFNKSGVWKPYEEKPTLPCSKKIIAYYLPQFHTTPENDANWGKGFTEWRNVSRALPIFSGHYQPRAPSDLGYYDLTTDGIIKEQARIARNYGLHGWAIYYYWFNSQRVLYKPIDIIFNDSSIDINYCLLWANENWTRSWDGGSNKVLIKQDHSPEDDIRFIGEVSKYFSDPRYITYNQSPVLMVYRTSLFPNMAETVDRWKNWCAINNVAVPYLVNSQTFRDYTAPQTIGFDASAEFPPHQSALFDRKLLRTVISGLKVFDPDRDFVCHTYDSFINASTHDQTTALGYKLFRCVFPEWDNSSRRVASRSAVYYGSNPTLYKQWLKHCINRADKEDLVFINAWNEWAEGAYLEPDLFNGYAYLDATWDAIHESLAKDKSQT